MRFRRKQDEARPDSVTLPAETPLGGEEVRDVPSAGHRPRGPWDAAEVEIDETRPDVVDLGSLLVTLREGLDLQLQVDQASGRVVAALLAGTEGALELRPFAAPRNGDVWEQARTELAAEVARRGGTATEAEGEYGTELRVLISVTTPDGRTGTQPSRVIGITGPRWLLRATVFGKPAVEPQDDGLIESALRDVVVRRGGAAHAPGDALPMQVPAALREQQAAQLAQQEAQQQAQQQARAAGRQADDRPDVPADAAPDAAPDMGAPRPPSPS